ncbi:DEAD/DEAH box helicase [Yinghuangia sp. ASG 101]|uniref:DEAD/DEAH box helicase n=1 Tax=Yinghuangia sp. ASG 101 TaxID=2896848 RepID=UPI001E548421|nr:DEAD/DEAH box helicase [Yinghuangia sp. ASG 101]UGQ15017.1 DEAD/DEAH box helicase [Yinghuangia sp. ASG 101]
MPPLFQDAVTPMPVDEDSDTINETNNDTDTTDTADNVAETEAATDAAEEKAEKAQNAEDAADAVAEPAAAPVEEPTQEPADDAVAEPVPADEADEADGAADDAEGAEADAPPPGPTFGELGVPDALVEALERRGVRHAFPIQAAALPDALGGRDILGRGRTGSGKTLGFGLPTLTRLRGQKARAKRPLALVLVPTRELAMQVHDALEPYGRVLDLRMKVVCGGMSMPRQIMALERGVELLVATPGRLQDLVDRGACSLDAVKIAVLDEADQMADMGFLPEVSALLDLVPAGGQRMLFSATLDNGVDAIVKRYLADPVTHSVDPHASSITTMTHHVFTVQPKDKVYVTAAIAARRGRTMVFVRTKFGADRVAAQLREAGVRAEALHGGMTQGARTRTLTEFKEGQTPVLVATDVAARGIHVDGIDLVLHVDPAADPKDYLHRAGRTARAGETGMVVTLALPHQRRTVDRLMESAGVAPERLRVSGSSDPEMRRITGARTLSEVKAQSVADAAVAAEEEAERLAVRIVELKAKAAELRRKAAELAESAQRQEAAERSRPARPERSYERGERPSGDRPRRDDRPRDDRGGRDDRPRGSRGDRSYGDRGGYGERSYDRGRRASDERPAYGERPTYGERSYGDRDRPRRDGGFRDGGRPGGFSRDRHDGGHRAPRADRSDRPAYGDRPRGERPYSDRPFNDRPRGERTYDRAPRHDRHDGPRREGDRKPRWKS